jgi:hypothetical protein
MVSSSVLWAPLLLLSSSEAEMDIRSSTRSFNAAGSLYKKKTPSISMKKNFVAKTKKNSSLKLY